LMCCSGDSFTVRDMFIMTPCAHAFCNSCIVGYLTAKISEGNVSSIRCLAPDCGSEFKVEQLKQLLPEELYLQYQEFAFNTAMASRPGVVWCPRASCGIVMFGDPDRPIMVRASQPQQEQEECRLTPPWTGNVSVGVSGMPVHVLLPLQARVARRYDVRRVRGHERRPGRATLPAVGAGARQAVSQLPRQH